MSELVEPQSAQPDKPGWWKRRSKKAKFLLIVLALFIVLIAISAIAGGGSDDKTVASNNNTTASSSGDESSGDATTSSAPKAAPLVHGQWKAGCNQFSAGDLDACKAIRGSKVTCQWEDDDVRMTVVFKNAFAAHVTVHVNPIYKLLNAGLHGNGLTSTKDVGLDPGEVRTVTVTENPAGVDGHPRITLCQPQVDVLQGVELG